MASKFRAAYPIRIFKRNIQVIIPSVNAMFHRYDGCGNKIAVHAHFISYFAGARESV